MAKKTFGAKGNAEKLRKKEEEKKKGKSWGIFDLFDKAVDKMGEGIDKALKDEQ